MPPTADRLDARAVALLIVLAACWGLNQAAVKFANEGIPPVLQAGLRSVVATVLVALWMRWRGIGLPLRGPVPFWGVVAGVLFGAEFLFIYQGLALTTASRGVLFLYSAPFFVAVGAHFLLRDDPLTPVRLLGLVAAFAGLCLAFGDSLSLPSREALWGDVLCLIGAALWAATIILIKATPLRSAPGEQTLLYQLLVSAILVPIASTLLGESADIRWTPSVALWFAYQAVVISFGTYLIWFWMMTRYRASQMSSFSLLTPVFGVVAGVVLLDERLSWSLAGAVALLAVGLWLVNRPGKPATA